MIFKKLLTNLVNTNRSSSHNSDKVRSLLRREANIGGQLFGSVPNGHRREFFCLDEYTWIWHEEWMNEFGVLKTRTTRYDIRPTSILKSQDGHGYKDVGVEEAKRLYEAVQLYEKRVNTELYATYA